MSDTELIATLQEDRDHLLEQIEKLAWERVTLVARIDHLERTLSDKEAKEVAHV